LDYEVTYVTLNDIEKSTLNYIIKKVNPYFLLSINYSPEIALICSKNSVKYVSWTVDPLPPNRFNIIENTDKNNNIIFTHRKEDLNKFKDLGFENSHHLILAASRDRVLQKNINLKYKTDISFVGVTLKKEEEKLWEYLKSINISVELLDNIKHNLDVNYRYVIENNIVYDEIAGELPDFIFNVLESQREVINKKYLASLLNGYYSFKHRINTVLEIENISIYGDSFWNKLSSNYKGVAEHKIELSQIYANSLLNFDVSRFYQKSSINMRVFDSMACGGVVLTEKNDTISQIFQDDLHYINYLDKNWRDILQNRAKLNGVAMKAYREVDAKHRVKNRVETIFNLI